MCMGYELGIDIGGTFTDVIVSKGRQTWTAKAFSTRDVVTGIIGGLQEVSSKMSIEMEMLIPEIERFVLGNTIVTNAIESMSLARVGLITTKGFGDTLRIARSPRTNERNPHLFVQKPDIVDRRDIIEINERVDAKGRVVVPLDEEQVKIELQKLLDKGVQAVATCFLWSFKNSNHEQRVKEILNELDPNVPCTLSSEISPVFREYERMVTTVLDAAVKPIVANHFKELEQKFQELGLRCGIKIMQVHGGFTSVEEVSKYPINMYNSGPVGGVIASQALGKLLGKNKLITADMGGTTFDTSLINGGEIKRVQRAEIGPFSTSLTAVDIVGIGAGGGSIAWLDSRGMLKVGPKSAGSHPGPICYDNGGQLPTITDAAIILNLLDSEYYLGGSIKISREKAVLILNENLAQPLGLSKEKTAAGIYKLTAIQMANSIRTITVNRGYDAREFSLVSFGGATGLFAAAIAHELGIKEVIIPNHASVFSATGLLSAEPSYSAVKTVPWTFEQSIEMIENVYQELDQKAFDWFNKEGIKAENRTIIREADMKYQGQFFEVTSVIPNGKLTERHKEEIRNTFISEYESNFGKGMAWENGKIEMINARVRAVGVRQNNDENYLKASSNSNNIDSQEMIREIFDPISNEFHKVPIYRGGIHSPVRGLCLVELPDTTVFVPRFGTLEPLDSGGGLRLTLE